MSCVPKRTLLDAAESLTIGACDIGAKLLDQPGMWLRWAIHRVVPNTALAGGKCVLVGPLEALLESASAEQRRVVTLNLARVRPAFVNRPFVY